MNALSSSSIVRNGERLSNSLDFDRMTPIECIKILKSIPSVKANRDFKAFILKLKRKII